MSEPVRSIRQAPQLPSAQIAELTMLVGVPGRPQAVRAFTDLERDLAEQYAAQEGGVLVPLSAVAGDESDDPGHQNGSGGPVEPLGQA